MNKQQQQLPRGGRQGGREDEKKNACYWAAILFETVLRPASFPALSDRKVFVCRPAVPRERHKLDSDDLERLGSRRKELLLVPDELRHPLACVVFHSNET